MILRPATPADSEALADLGAHAFRAAFEHLYKPADLAAFLSENHSPAKVAKEIADPGMAIRVAEEDGALTGFCKVLYESALPTHSDAQRPFELKQLYTEPTRIGAGIGAALMDWALAEARSSGADEVQLSVWSGNTGAQRFYARYGFAKIADITFRVGDQLDHEFMFARKL